jgi:EmrB/QacA subfamily drug resistance transporter
MTTQALGTPTDGVPFRMRDIMAPLIAIILGMFMAILDATAVNVALPTLVTDLKSPLNSLQWVITGYTLAQAAVIPLAGWLSDRFGAKRIFLTAITLFTIGSVMCAVAQNSGMLITFRILQGLGGGFVMPVGMAYTYRLSPPDKRGAVMGALGVPILLAPALGPTLAGWLVQYADWRWIFLINLPVGFVAMYMGITRLPALGRQAVVGLDIAGIILGPLSFAAISYGVSEGSTSWTSVNTLGGLIGGAVILLVFIAVELTRENPLLELRVFKSLDFSLAIVTQWIAGIALFGGMFLIPLFLQSVRGYGAFDTGLILIAQAGTAAIFMPVGGRLFDLFGARPLVFAGLALVGGGSFLLTRLTGTTSGADLIPALILRGAGMALMMMPLNTHVLNSAPRKLVSRVTALTQALQSVISSLAVAGLSTILTSRPAYKAAHAQLTALQHQAAQAGGSAAHASHGLPLVIGNLFASAYGDAFKVMVIAAVIGVGLSFTLRKKAVDQTAPETVAVENAALEMAG